MEPVAEAVQALDLVIAGGRVVDPETGLDAVRHVGIRDGAVVAVSESPLIGAVTVDATGLVVAPGFIDLHAHGQDPDEQPLPGDGRGDDGAGARDRGVSRRPLVPARAGSASLSQLRRVR